MTSPLQGKEALPGSNRPARAGTEPVTIDVGNVYLRSGETALLENLPAYEADVLELAGAGRDVVLTGRGPIWLYLRLAHALHGVARTLVYRTGQGDDVKIFDHSARRV